MKAVFSISGDMVSGVGGIPGEPSFDCDLVVCFNGKPGDVVLEIYKTTSRYEKRPVEEVCSMRTDIHEKEDNKTQTLLIRSTLKASHARAIASTLLSAATEAKAS